MTAAADKPFAWGTFDCCLFASDCFLAVTGIDPAVPFFRGRYESELQARALIKAFAGGGVLQLLGRISRHYEIAPVPPHKAIAGDPVCTRVGGQPMLGAIDIVRHDLVALVTPQGLCRLPLKQGATILGIP